jgi:hypothetical protein
MDRTPHVPAGAGSATPEGQKCERPGHHNQAAANHHTTDSADCAEPCASVQTPEKRFESLRAQLAMRGHELYATAGGIYIVRRWGLCRDLTSLDAVENFAQQVGAL